MTDPLPRHLVQVSRRLAMVLRHRPEVVGIALDEQGWVRVDVLLEALRCQGSEVSRADLDAVVAGNDKRRFALQDRADGAWIRASQGHSARVGVDLGLIPVEPPAELYHGTATKNQASIEAAGLRPGRRQHVHLSPDIETATRVGRRHSADVLIFEVAAAALAASGHPFYLSANGVWLTDAVPPAHLIALTA